LLCLRNSTTSASSSFASSTPATSAKVTDGRLPAESRARLLPKAIAWSPLARPGRFMKEMKIPPRIRAGRKGLRALSQPPQRLAGLVSISTEAGSMP
jgi:hypothetical protein